MNYFQVSFNYEAIQLNRRKVSPEWKDSAELTAAISVLDGIARTAKLPMRNAYAWPDGSLYQYFQADNAETISRQFRRVRTILSDGLNVFQVYLDAACVEQVDPKKLEASEYLTLEEKFTLSREEQHKRYLERIAQRKAIYQKYSDKRESCPDCQPGRFGCPSCSQVFDECSKAEREWRQQV